MDSLLTHLPELDALWDFENPAETERVLRELLPLAEASEDRVYLVGLLTQIARAQGLQGEFKDGHATLDKAESVAPDGSPVTKVRLLLERGRLHNSAGEPAKGRPFFQLAWETGRSAGEDSLAVDAAHMIANVSPAEESINWNQTALELAESSADPKARRWRPSLFNNMGWTYFDQGAFETALGLFERAVPLRVEAGKPTELRVARWSVARALRAVGRVEEALSLQRQLLAQEATGELEADGFVSEEIGECLLQLRRAESARPHFAAALALLSRDPWLEKNEPQRLARLRDLAGAEPQ